MHLTLKYRVLKTKFNLNVLSPILRIAYLLLAYHSNVIFFGDAYFFLIWAFILFVVVGTGVTLYKSRSASAADGDEEDLLEDDDEGLDRR